MKKFLLAFSTFALVGITSFAAPALADLDDPEGPVTIHGIVRELSFAENECADIPDSLEYRYFLETREGDRLCLTPKADSGITSFKYYLNKLVKIEGERCCGFPKVTVHSVVLDESRDL